MEVFGQLVLSPDVWECIAGQARDTYPDEAVGLLGGTPDGRVACVAPLPNLAAEFAFLADPRAQFEAERAIQRLELIPIAAYHSHPGGTPTLSRADRLLARRSLLQLVIGVARSGRVVMRAYQAAGPVREVPVRIEDTLADVPGRPTVVE
jgi:proteasome lid subunit RPN8/RPN11